jgi:hypothetical protein
VQAVVVFAHRLVERKRLVVFGIGEIAAIGPAFGQQRGQVQISARWVGHGRTPYSRRDGYGREGSKGSKGIAL